MQMKLTGCQHRETGLPGVSRGQESWAMSPGDARPSAQVRLFLFGHVVHKEALWAVQEEKDQAWSSAVLWKIPSPRVALFLCVTDWNPM